MLNVERYRIRIRMMYLSATNNLASSICMLDRGRPAGAQSAAKCTNMALQLLYIPLHHAVRTLVSMRHLAMKEDEARRMRTNRADCLLQYFSFFLAML